MKFLYPPKEQPEHPAWPAWVEYTGHVPGTSVGFNSSWPGFRDGWDMAHQSMRSIDSAEVVQAIREQPDESRYALDLPEACAEVEKYAAQRVAPLVRAIESALMHLETNYDIDGNSMKDSDAVQSLREPLCAVREVLP